MEHNFHQQEKVSKEYNFHQQEKEYDFPQIQQEKALSELILMQPTKGTFNFHQIQEKSLSEVILARLIQFVFKLKYK